MQQHVAFTSKVEAFLNLLGGRMRRLPILAGTPHGDRDVSESLKDRMATVIGEYQETVAEFGVDTRPDTLERTAERIKVLRHTLEGYKLHVGDEYAFVSGKLDEAAQKLKDRIAQITEVRNQEAGSGGAECDFCHLLQAVPHGAPKHRCKGCGQEFEIEWS
jgi:hypothetical protein